MSFMRPREYEDLDHVLDHAYTFLDSVNQETETAESLANLADMPKWRDYASAQQLTYTSINKIMRGGVMHRFANDAAIEAYCEENYLDSPKTNEVGKVEAWCEYRDTYIQIGWIH
jgi:hypothetical protein